ncbi:MAG: sigma-70 family RNA polymerase sigma factor [Planctomycetota bacterium]|nr:sigma-70 family RNA polymerase sigma factor [Planctomycetota bacterium]
MAMLAVDARFSLELYAELFALNYEAMYRVSYGVLRDQVEAEDVAVTAFDHAVENAQKYRPNVGTGSGNAWMKQIAKRKALDRYRRNRSRRRCLDELEGRVSGEQRNATGLQHLDDLEVLLRRARPPLTAEEHDLLVLRYCAGLDYVEIEERTGEPVGVLHQRHFRAITKLREGLAGEQP